MKFHEAIDMIMDGGRARRLGQRELIVWYIFNSGQLVANINGEIRGALLYKQCFTELDWIVEKDGVVYDEHPEHKLLLAPTVNLYDSIESGKCYCGNNEGKLYQSIVDKREIFCEPCARGGMATARVFNMIRNGDLLVIKDRVHEQGEPLELEDKDDAWKEIKMPIIADEVNEEWLEKKMLCFLLRKRIASWEDGKLELGLYKEKNGTCCRKECEFCFPQENLKANHMVDAQFLEDHLGKMPQKNDHSADVHEKVTVDNIVSLVGEIKNQWFWYGKKPCSPIAR